MARSKAARGVALCVAHGDEDEGFEGEAEGVGIEVCAVAADCTGAFQGPQAAVAGREAEADTLGEFGDGEPPVLLECGKYSPVNVIHEQDSPSSAR